MTKHKHQRHFLQFLLWGCVQFAEVSASELKVPVIVAFTGCKICPLNLSLHPLRALVGSGCRENELTQKFTTHLAGNRMSMMSHKQASHTHTHTDKV